MSKVPLQLFSSLSVVILSAIALSTAGNVAIAQEQVSRNAAATTLTDYSLDLPELVALEQAAPDAPPPAPPVEEKKTEEKKPEPTNFLSNTKLTGQVIFGLNSGLSGDISRNVIFGQRTRIELATTIGNGTLTTRLQSSGFGLVNNDPSSTVQTPEGSASFADGDTSSAVGIDLLKYDVAIGPNTQLILAGNAATGDDFADPINPLFDGDGASGSISRFGNRPSIYYLADGAGAGIRHKFSSKLEGSIGYLASAANNPSVGNGLAGGGYGAIAQLTYLPSESTKFGLTYVNSRNSSFGIGSANADSLLGSNNTFGLQAFSQVSPKLALGGWVGYTKNSSPGATKDILTWAVTVGFPDLGAPGNLGGLVVGQEPRVTAATGTATADSGSSLHLEGFYQVKLNDSLSITPGVIYLTAPDHNSANAGALIGTIRTTFTF
jgi:hypothetical protein